MDDEREGERGLVFFAPEGVEDHPAYVPWIEGLQRHLRDGPLLAERCEGDRERVSGVNLVVPVRPDDQQVPCARVGSRAPGAKSPMVPLVVSWEEHSSRSAMRPLVV